MNEDRLVADISRYATAYYKGVPLISDQEFDRLVEQLRLLDPNNKILTTPGWGYKPEGIKYKHVTTVGSLDKVKLESDSSKQNIINKYSKDYIFTPKLDGGSVVCYYINGKLDRIISRGNGTEGIDITNIIIKNCVIPFTVEENIKAVRGEIVISKVDFNRHLSNDYSNLRNAATGISQATESPYSSLLQFVAYSILEGGDENYVTQLSTLRNNNFKTVPIITISNIDEFEQYSPSNSSYEFEVDGIVVCNNKVKIVDNISYYDAFAIKYEAESTLARVTGIDWQKSKHGKLTPVINFEPVELSGATITKCSGFNAKAILDNNLGCNSIIKICRSNEVIPYWIETIASTGAEIPSYYDDKPTFWQGVNLNIDVDEEEEIVNSVLEDSLVFGAGSNSKDVIVELFDITTFDKLLWVCREDFVNNGDNILWVRNRLGEVRTNLIMKSLLNVFTKERTLADLLVLSNLTGVGKVAANIIAEEYDNKDEFIKILIENNGLPSEVNAKLPTYVPCKSIEDNIDLLIKFLKLPFNAIKFQKNDKVGTKIAFTGKLSKTRKELLEYWNTITPVEEVTIKKAQYLITNDPNSSSSKNKIADKLGITKLTEEQFVEMIKE